MTASTPTRIVALVLVALGVLGLAYLRFAGPISETVARLATGLGGLTPSRTGFAPAGRHPKFHEGIATSNSL